MKKIGKIKKIIKFIREVANRDVEIGLNNSQINTTALSGSVVLITGGSSGIGLSISKAFVKNGAIVAIAGRNIDKMKKITRELGDHSSYFSCDVTKIAETDSTVAACLKRYGRIDILVNCAGVFRPDNNPSMDFFEQDEKTYDCVIDTNFKGTFFLTQKVAQYYISNKIVGKIINICSVDGLKPGYLPYPISKWEEVGFTENLHKILKDYGVEIWGIAPGPTATDMMGFKAGDSMYREGIPVRKVGLPDEIANLAVFLASGAGKSLSDRIIRCDGGQML